LKTKRWLHQDGRANCWATKSYSIWSNFLDNSIANSSKYLVHWAIWWWWTSCRFSSSVFREDGMEVKLCLREWRNEWMNEWMNEWIEWFWRDEESNERNDVEEGRIEW
jgi:hypothetical protein